MIRFIEGNLFDSTAEALVNTVNCVGVMGKGIAYQFKRAYPEMHKDYVRRCNDGQIRLGEVTAFRERGKVIVNFPTKSHWRSASKLEDIVGGLAHLRSFLLKNGIRSIAIPPLGCGNGGLAWSDVRGLIERELDDLKDVDVQVYAPAGNFESTVANEPHLSLGHLVLAAIRSELTNPTKLNIQKAAYFFNVFWGEQYFKFNAYRYGPYSVALEPMFATIRDYLAFVGAQASELASRAMSTNLKGADAERLAKMLVAVRSAAKYCNARESRLELLATAHAVVERSPEASEHDVVDSFLGWSPEKAKRFGPAHVTAALEELMNDGLVRKTLLGYVVQSPVTRNGNVANGRDSLPNSAVAADEALSRCAPSGPRS
jgi:O-acetyl-ADP-ribose deacetylase (regulator of RNase III)